MSYSRFKQSDLRFPGGLVLNIFHLFGLCDVRHYVGEDEEYMECSNLTIINLMIKVLGPINEGTLTKFLSPSTSPSLLFPNHLDLSWDLV